MIALIRIIARSSVPVGLGWAVVRVLYVMYVRRHAAASPCVRWPHRLQQLAVCGVRDIYHVGLCVIARRWFSVRGVGAPVIECCVQWGRMLQLISIIIN